MNLPIKEIHVKSVLNKHKTRDSWFLEDYTTNPYTGCSFNCVYCYVNGSKYGEKIKKGISVKINGPDVLHRQLKNRARKEQYGFVALGSATDPYIPLEKDLNFTKEYLKILYRFKFPVHLFTKSTLCLRDMELLKKIREHSKIPVDLEKKVKGGLLISFSFSTMNENLARKFEPGAPTPKQRLNTMQTLQKEGFQVGACLIPVLPKLSDSREQLDRMIKMVKKFGGDYVLTGGLTLFGDEPQDCRMRYFQTLQNHHPELVEYTENLFSGSSFPPFRYQRRITQLAHELCVKNGIKSRIC